MAPYCRHCERDFNNTHDHGKHMRMRHGEDPYAPKLRYAEYCRGAWAAAQSSADVE